VWTRGLRIAQRAPLAGGSATNLLAAAILAVVFGAVIARQLTGRGPTVWAIFTAGAFGTVLSGVLSLSGAEAALATSAPVLAFLFSLFLFAGALQRSGGLDHLARWLIGRASRPEELPAVVFVGFGIASAFLVNDALVVIGVPLLLALARRLGSSPRPLLLTLAYGVTVGSALTPFGNPQNLLVSVASGFSSPVTTFLRYLLLPTAINLAIGAVYLRYAFRAEVPERGDEFRRLRAEAPPLIPTGGWGDRVVRSPVLWVFPGTMIVMITLDLTAAVTHGPPVPIWETAAAGAVVLLLASPERTRIVHDVDWTILLLFAGLFVVVGGAIAGGVIPALTSLLPIPGPAAANSGLLAIAATSTFGPQIVSNVPWVALQIPVLSSLGYGSGTPIAWIALAATSTLAGNVTLLGAASNLIVTELAEKGGVVIRLGAFMRHGLPLAAISIAVVVLALWFGL
jgi:Na+/H+ antiporter NhaD/arsenite permease-like protein